MLPLVVEEKHYSRLFSPTHDQCVATTALVGRAAQINSTLSSLVNKCGCARRITKALQPSVSWRNVMGICFAQMRMPAFSGLASS